MTIQLILAFCISFVVSAAFGKIYIPWLRNIHAGQQIKPDGPVWHMSKSGTPTMGGFLFILGTFVACITVGFHSITEGKLVHLFVFAFALVFGAIGFLDDWEKLRHKQNLGLSAGVKFLLQLVAAFIYIFFLIRLKYISSSLYIPFFNTTLFIPRWLYVLLSIFAIVGTVNAVNITDGVDGLATGTSIPVLLFFVAAAFLWGIEKLEIGLFSSALLGGLFAFLIYNFNPAKVFMGDTGSLFLGGAIAALAFVYDMPLILITVGIVYLIETLSDIIQVGYFKLTHGKRVFKMAPFHHHLEMGGWTGKKWSEKELFFLFTGTSLLFAVLSFLGIINRY
jgi:phospho-N-acetylmuramoyl-pentapeptide-transferase